MTRTVTLDDVMEARDRIAGDVHRTPLQSSRLLGERIGAPLLLKCENLQKTGAFKVRGALNYVRKLLEAGDPPAGVVTISAGNHAQAVAWAGTAAGVSATVVMPESAPRAKVEASRDYGGRVVLHGDVFEAFRKAEELAEEEGLDFVHPFDDEAVIAGQGTVAVELHEELDAFGTVAVPLGGGGLLSGCAVALAGLRPSVKVYGVEPEGAAAMRRSLDRGRPVRLDAVETVADGLGAPMAGELTFDLVRRHVDDVVTVTDAELGRAMELLLSRGKLLTEPAGAAGVAGLLSGRIPVDRDAAAVAILSGGNVDLERLPDLLRPGAG